MTNAAPLFHAAALDHIPDGPPRPILADIAARRWRGLLLLCWLRGLSLPPGRWRGLRGLLLLRGPWRGLFLPHRLWRGPSLLHGPWLLLRTRNAGPLFEPACAL